MHAVGVLEKFIKGTVLLAYPRASRREEGC